MHRKALKILNRYGIVLENMLLEFIFIAFQGKPSNSFTGRLKLEIQITPIQILMKSHDIAKGNLIIFIPKQSLKLAPIQPRKPVK